MKHKAIFFLIFCTLSGILARTQAPSANFTADITTGCSPLLVNFKDQSGGNPTSWQWDLGNGATSSSKNPSATYFAPGAYTIKLVVANATGKDSITKVTFINVTSAPQVNFEATKTAGCGPTTVQFRDLSVAGAGTTNTTWLWDFGDGATSTQQNPTHTFTSPELYTITLKVTNDKGCFQIHTKPNFINISENAVADFSYSQPATCGLPKTVNFTNASAGPGSLSYIWNFGDGSSPVTDQNPSHPYNASGKFSVTLITVSNLGCSDTVQKEVIVGSYLTDFTVSKSCQGAITQFTNASAPQPISSLWRFPDGSTSTEINPKKILSLSGPVQVKLINNYGPCTDSVTKTITISGKPVTAFSSADTIKCAPPSTVNFANSSNAATYQWDFGDGGTSRAATPTHSYTQFGNFTVTLIATTADGCSDTLRKTDFIKIRKPVITFPDLPQKGCIPYAARFNAEITTLDKVSGYQWDFGDGNTSAAPAPNHTYTTRGSYNVTLTITTSTGCTEKYTLNNAVQVGPKPTANFTVNKTEICADEKVQLTDQSVPANEITEWIWTFSDSTKSNDKNPLHQFADTGMINVQLVALNNGCPSDPVVKNRLIHVKPPIAKFTYRPDCNKRNEITFTNTSIVDPALPTTWEWNFGDGTTYSGQTPPPHNFPSSFGTWNVSLKITNGSCTFTYSETIRIVDQTPDITATSVTGCKPFLTTFQATSAVPIVSSFWDFGDGTTVNDTGSSKAHTFFKTGTYTVKVTTTDKFGCQNSRSKDLYIKVYGPTADFVGNGTQGCKGLTSAFEDKSTTDGQHPITSWKWNFGDSTVQTFSKPPFQHKYDTSGNFDVVLEVKDSFGCVDTLRKSSVVTVSSLKADWQSVRQTCPGSTFQFLNQSPGTNFTSVWDLGDGNTSTDRSPMHAYSDTGFYTVKLKVADSTGCVDSLIRTKYVQVGVPQASFTANTLITFCTPFQGKFTNTSTYYTDRIWDLGVATSRRENPTLYYTSTGIYDIRLIVTSPGGCKDTAIRQLKVFNPGDAKFTYGPVLEGCRPVKMSFEAFEEMEARFVWDFGDGNVIDTTVNKIEHVYKDFGSFTPKIIMTDPTGTCKVPLTGSAPIEIYGAKASFAVTNTANLFCDSVMIRFRDSTTYHDQSISYNWNYGDGNTSVNAKDSMHFYPAPGNYDLSLTVTTGHGCVDSLRSKPFKVVQSPLIAIQSDSVICANERMRHAGVFQRSDTSAVRWLWQFPNGNTAMQQYPANQLYNTAGDYVVTAYAVNSSGCADTATQRVHVNPIPKVDMPSTLTTQVGFPITIPAKYDSSVVNYSWQPGATLDCANCPQPTANPKFNTLYTVNITDENGCKNTGEVQVVVLCKGATVFLPNTFSPNGDGSNDVFYVRGKLLDRVKSLRVFSRWGEVVFDKRDFSVNDASAGWDGRYKGANPVPDVYIYQVEVYCENGEIIRFEGNVALIL